MTKQEKYLIKSQIEELKLRKEFLIAEMIGACEEINHEIKYLRKQLKEQKRQ